MTCQKTIFLVSAQLQSGKDSFGEPLAKRLEAAVISFADPLKEIACTLGMPAEVAYGGEAERRAWKKFLLAKGRECDGREWLQWLGTEFGREQISDNLWVRLLLERVGRSSRQHFVVTDARFKNEILEPIEELARELGLDVRFVRIRLSRPDAPGGEIHPSETEQLSIPDARFDEVVINDGTLKDLQNKAEKIADKYRS